MGYEYEVKYHEKRKMYTYTSRVLKDTEEIGTFEIYGPGFNTGKTMALNIYIEDEYQGKGLSKKLIKNMCTFLKENVKDIRKDQLLFIDADASDGFWEHIGMKPNKYYNTRRNVEGAGYELVFTFADLCDYAFARKKIGRANRKKSTKKKKRKSKKRRGLKRSRKL